MKKIVKYTFLLPAYKSEFLQASIQSILDQSYHDISVIVSDDCSPEDIRAVVDGFNDSRIVYRRNEKNIGAEHLVDHWNLLLGLADSEYVIMASDDDIYHKDFISEIDRLVKENPEVNVLRARMAHIDENGRSLGSEPRANADILLSQQEYICALSKCEFYSGMSQYVFKRSNLLGKGGFVYFPAAWFSDELTVYDMSDKGIVISGDVLCFMRMSDISISAGKQSPALVRNKIDASAEYAKYIKRYAVSSGIYESLIEKARQSTLFALNNLPNIFHYISLMRYAKKYPGIYPLEWRVRRILGHIYWDRIKNKK